VDERPPIWLGHSVLTVSDVDRAADFWRRTGMREIHRNAEVAIFELRGGTHVILAPGTPDPAADVAFDLMVEDLDATHARWAKDGLNVGPIEHGRIHNAFTVTDPDGNRVTVNSSHVMGPV
jgi:catechol 2,3-dioxygenase-like lactoylglutathione lyase family enzyme